jgi:RNA polymerase II subunit A small phosphatase-like protein
MARGKKLIILDLDETLVFGFPLPLGRPPDFRTSEGSFVYRRPGLERFIEYCLGSFHVAVWTSAAETYAGDVVRKIFPDPKALAFFWARDRCTEKFDQRLDAFFWIKDLGKVKKLGFALERILIIDDSAEASQQNLENLILVGEYKGQLEDDELPRLERYLESIKNSPDFRAIDKRSWKKNIP